MDRFRSKSKFNDPRVQGSSEITRKPIKTINSKTTADNSRFSSEDQIDLTKNLDIQIKETAYIKDGVKIEEEKHSGSSDSFEFRKRTDGSKEGQSSSNLRGSLLNLA